MRSHCAVYVDAGYLLASAATRVTGSSLRSAVHVDHYALIEGLIRQVEEESGLPLLRVNWYDSRASVGPLEPILDRIGMLPRVKLRLGRMSPGGLQKGVDLRIGLDLTTQARNRVADVMYLVSGDDDLTEAVEEAQDHGVQVILLAAPSGEGTPHAVARNLQREADGVVVIDPAVIDRAVTKRTAPAPIAAVAAASGLGAPPVEVEEPAADADTAGARRPSPADLAGVRRAVTQTPEPTSRIVYTSAAGYGPGAATGHPTPVPDDVVADVDEVARKVVRSWMATSSAEERRAARVERPYVPAELDAALLTDLSDRLGTYYLDDSVRHQLREGFWRAFDALQAAG